VNGSASSLGLAGGVLLALGVGGCASEPVADELVPHAYAISAIPFDGFFSGRPIRFELGVDGHLEGHSADDSLRCRATLTEDDWVRLTGALNRARVLDLVGGVRMIIDVDAWHVAVSTTDGRSNRFDFGDSLDRDSLRESLGVMQEILDAVHATGACGPDWYSVPG